MLTNNAGCAPGRLTSVIGITVGPVVLALIISPFALASQAANPPRGKKPLAPQATEALPVQPKDRGFLMPLHVSSVLSWTCADPGLQSAMRTSKTGCYSAMRPVVAACTAALQAKAPAGGKVKSTAANPRMDILTFRAAYRDCLRQKYSDRMTAAGQPMALGMATTADPLAARINAYR